MLSPVRLRPLGRKAYTWKAGPAGQRGQIPQIYLCPKPKKAPDFSAMGAKNSLTAEASQRQVDVTCVQFGL